MANVMVVSPHPDDDILGCCGTIRRHLVGGDWVSVVYVTDGELGIPGTDPDSARAIRIHEAGVCSQVMATSQVTMLHLPDMGVASSEDQLLEKLLALVRRDSIEIIYGPSEGDSHPDHASTYRVLDRLVHRHQRVTEFWQYEIWSPHSRPSRVVDITPAVTTKLKALNCFQSQMSRNPFIMAILALNQYRGLLHGNGVMYAEAFTGGPV